MKVSRSDERKLAGTGSSGEHFMSNDFTIFVISFTLSGLKHWGFKSVCAVELDNGENEDRIFSIFSLKNIWNILAREASDPAFGKTACFFFLTVHLRLHLTSWKSLVLVFLTHIISSYQMLVGSQLVFAMINKLSSQYLGNFCGTSFLHSSSACADWSILHRTKGHPVQQWLFLTR